MGSFHHEAPSAEAPRDPVAESRNARIGLILFGIYSLGYLAYVLVNAFSPSWMEAVGPGGLNWAVISGLILIAEAMVLALVYLWLCFTPKGGSSS